MKLHYVIGTLFVTVSMLTVTLSHAVHAQSENGSGDGRTSQQNASNDRVEERRQQIEVRAREAQEQRQVTRDDRQTDRSERRKTACEARLQNINGAVSERSNKVKSLAEKYESVYERTSRFIETNDLAGVVTAEYQAAQSARDEVSASYAAYRQLVTELNCDDPNMTYEKLQQARAAIDDIKESLRAYQVTLRDLITATVAVANSQRDQTVPGDTTPDSPTDNTETPPAAPAQ